VKDLKRKLDKAHKDKAEEAEPNSMLVVNHGFHLLCEIFKMPKQVDIRPGLTGFVRVTYKYEDTPDIVVPINLQQVISNFEEADNAFLDAIVKQVGENKGDGNM
jgi:hypothetical protein